MIIFLHPTKIEFSDAEKWRVEMQYENDKLHFQSFKNRYRSLTLISRFFFLFFTEIISHSGKSMDSVSVGLFSLETSYSTVSSSHP